MDLQAGPLSVDFDRRQVALAGKLLALTPIEYDLLKVFISQRGKVLTRLHSVKDSVAPTGSDHDDD